MSVSTKPSLRDDSPVTRRALLERMRHSLGEGEPLGWVLALRGVPFGAGARGRLRELTAKALPALHEARLLERRRIPANEHVLRLAGDGSILSACHRTQWLMESAALLADVAALVREVEKSRQPAARLALRYARVDVFRLESAQRPEFVVVLGPALPLPGRAWTVLSPAQRRVAELAAAGITVRGISEELGIASGTVRTHLGRVFERLGVSTRLELARAFSAEER